jgi:hypothetical protein
MWICGQLFLLCECGNYVNLFCVVYSLLSVDYRGYQQSFSLCIKAMLIKRIVSGCG